MLFDSNKEESEKEKFLSSLSNRDRMYFQPNTVVSFKASYPRGSYEYEREFSVYYSHKRRLEEEYDEAIEKDKQRERDKERDRLIDLAERQRKRMNNFLNDVFYREEE